VESPKTGKRSGRGNLSTLSFVLSTEYVILNSKQRIKMPKIQSTTKVKVKPRTDLELPRQFKVIYLNDEITTMDFVVSTLMEIFDHDIESASDLTQKIHEDGSAVVGVYTFEIAEHKGVEVTVMARANGFPLQVKVEPE
jgi:ATP-dependent Clp protease adaptor protein ClpS